MVEPRSIRSPQIPLTPYDLLGYIAPGGTLLLCVFLFEFWALKCDRALARLGQIVPMSTPIYTALVHLKPDGEDWVLSTLFIFVLIGIAYIAGHVVASISSIVLERVFVAKGYGFPYAWLLGLKESPNRRSPITGPFYRGLVFWVNLYLILWYGALLKYGPDLAASPRWLALLLYALPIWILLMCAAKIVGSFQFEDRRTRRYRLSRELHPLYGWLGIRTFKFFAKPYDLLAQTISRYMYTRHPFDEQFIKKYVTAFKRRFALDPEVADTNNFWFSYLYVREHSQRLGDLAVDWLLVYSFARNLSAAFYLGFLYCFGWLLISASDLSSEWQVFQVRVLLWLPLVFLAASGFMMLRYYYLYVSYFTKFVFRAFVFLSDDSAAPSHRVAS